MATKTKKTKKTELLFEVDEPVKPKKKKKKPVSDEVKKKKIVKADKVVAKVGKELAVYKKSKLEVEGTSKRKKRGNILAAANDKIHDMLEENDMQRAVPLMLKTLLQSVMSLLPYAEAQVRNTGGGKGVYQINSLISSVRELMADVQMTQDRALMGTTINTRFLQPEFRELAMATMQIYSLIAADAKEVMSEKAYERFAPLLRVHRDTHASKFSESYRRMSSDIVAYLEN